MPPKRKFSDRLAAQRVPYNHELRRAGLYTVRDMIQRVQTMAHIMNSLQRVERTSEVPTDKPVMREGDKLSITYAARLGPRYHIQADLTIPVDGGMSDARIVYDSALDGGPPLVISIQTEPEDGIEERGYEHYALGEYSRHRHALSAKIDKVPYIAMIEDDGSESTMTSEEFMDRAGHRLVKGIERKRGQLLAHELGKTAGKDMLVLVRDPESPKQ